MRGHFVFFSKQTYLKNEWRNSLHYQWKKALAKNEWENDESDFLWALYSVCKKMRAILFPYLLTCLDKDTSLMLKVICRIGYKYESNGNNAPYR